MDKLKVYAVKHTDEEIRAKSRSGGFFTAASDHVLNKNGVVYGCILDENFNAVHIRTCDKQGRDKMRGSKYIQSNIGNVFKNVKNDLSDGRYVLFSGTSCQVAGLKSFLKVDYDNLICIDIVCHGVPSPAVWHSYLEWLEKKNKGRCIDVDFRNKEKFGWAAHVETLKFEKNNRAKIVDSEVFKKLFYGHVILRPSCHKCPYKSINHPGDITIGDFWGIDTAALGFNDNKGVSLVLVNNDKGRVLFEDVSDTVILRECRIEDSMQPPLKAPANASKQRDQFWIDYYTRPFGYIVRKYGGRNIKGRIKKLFNAFFRKG